MTIDFDFISDEALQETLRHDYQELQDAIANNLWKSSHILAGSILEALTLNALTRIIHDGRGV